MMRPKNQEASTISSLKSFFSFTNPTMKKLMSLKHSEMDEKWAHTAVEVLVKRLKARKNSLDDLKKALTYPTIPSKCVTVPRSLDGRLHAWFRKGFPHVIYCRVWRWPDLESHHELKALEICEQPFSLKRSEVCINPYHYQRVKPIVVPPVVIMMNRDIPTNTPTTIPPAVQQVRESAMPQNVSLLSEEFLGDCDLNDIAEIIGNACSPGSFDWPILDNPVPSNEPISNATNTLTLTPPPENPAHRPLTTNQENLPQQDYSGNIEQLDFESLLSPNEMISDVTNTLALTPPPENSTYHTLTTNQEIIPQQNHSGNVENPDCQAILYEDTPCWTSIAYYELNTRVGEIFQSKSNRVNIDGFTDPSNTIERFCLGRLTNINRNSTAENTRRHIGHGIQFSYIGGEVWVECLSDSAVFVQSRLCNSVHGFNDNTVCKIPPKCSLMIFSNRDFSELLSKRVHEGFEAVFELAKMCTIRMSFVKGWGGQYHRQDVTATPCWIEAHLHGPLRWLDNVLVGMGSPLHKITSTS